MSNFASTKLPNVCKWASYLNTIFRHHYYLEIKIHYTNTSHKYWFKDVLAGFSL